MKTSLQSSRPCAGKKSKTGKLEDGLSTSEAKMKMSQKGSIVSANFDFLKSTKQIVWKIQSRQQVHHFKNTASYFNVESRHCVYTLKIKI